MCARGHFLTDITAFFKIDSGQFVEASFEHEGAFRHQINRPFGNGLHDAACLPVFKSRGFGPIEGWR